VVSHTPSPAAEQVQTRKTGSSRVACLFKREHGTGLRAEAAWAPEVPSRAASVRPSALFQRRL
jgi:hypothetical protein